MRLEISTEALERIEAEFKLIFVCAKEMEHGWVSDSALLKKMGFEGEDESLCLLPERGECYVGVENPADHESFRAAAAAAIRALGSYRIDTLAVGSYDEGQKLTATGAIAEGILLGAYRFDRYKSKPKPAQLQRVIFSTQSFQGGSVEEAVLSETIDRATQLCDAVNGVRDWVNTMPDTMTPEALAEEAEQIAKTHDLACHIHDEDFLREQKMGAFEAVSRASTRPPRLIHLSYAPEGAKKRVILVGKGLTYDSGGLSLKPSEFMASMKSDMAGGAGVLGVIKAAAALKLPVAIDAIVGATENMIAGNAYKPDDVLIAKNGKSIEVKNTDAEGRLVLADCLCYAQDTVESFDYIVDMATLTGACAVAVGDYTSGIMGHDSALKKQLLEAADRSGELAAELPFNKHLKKLIKSEVDDVCNIGSSRYGGAITAALFLAEFIEEKNRDKWAHIDIAGPGFVQKVWGPNPHGASGAGVRLLISWLEEVA